MRAIALNDYLTSLYTPIAGCNDVALGSLAQSKGALDSVPYLPPEVFLEHAHTPSMTGGATSLQGAVIRANAPTRRLSSEEGHKGMGSERRCPAVERAGTAASANHSQRRRGSMQSTSTNHFRNQRGDHLDDIRADGCAIGGILFALGRRVSDPNRLDPQRVTLGYGHAGPLGVDG
jgi:hypothetical protein